jgi:putative exosortase-associated protein (TIGR04073 family)
MASPAMADIQDPPMHDHGPARKLGRGWANFLYGSAEVWTTVQRTNELEGNTAAATYGIVKGFGRMFARMGTGVYVQALLPPQPTPECPVGEWRLR